MISLGTARKLKAAGLGWKPAVHDFFAIPDRGLDDRLFVISDMSIDIEHLYGRQVVAFNGASEWALDYMVTTELVWMPTEEQLRRAVEQRLAEPQIALRRAIEPDRYELELHVRGQTITFEAPDAGEAYATALLHLLEQQSGQVFSRS